MNAKDYEELYVTLLDVASRGSFREIAEAAYKIIRHPIVLIDVEYNVVVQVPQEPIGDYIWDTLLKEKLVPATMVWDFNNFEYVRANRETEGSILVDWGMVKQLPRIMGGVRVGGEIAGYIGILYPEGIPEEDIRAGDILMKAFAIEFRRRMSFPAEVHPLRNVFLSEIYHCRIKTIEELEEWQRHAGMTIPGGYTMVCAKPAGKVYESALIKYISSQIEKRLKCSYTIVADGAINIILARQDMKSDQTDSDMGLLDVLKPILLDLKLQAGVSGRFESILEIGPYIYQSRRALELLESVENDGTTAFYSETVLEDIFSKIRSGIHEVNSVHPAIFKLSASDKKNDTEYLPTLRNYLNQMKDSSRTCRIMNIHRNTLLYRLDRIRQLTGIDLDDVNTCTHILISFHLIS